MWAASDWHVSPRIDYCGEGATDAAAARRLIVSVGGEPGIDFTSRKAPRGKQGLDRRLPGLVISATFAAPVLVLRDLDQDAPCAGALVQRLLQGSAPALLLRIAVRAVESWMMADRAALADALGVKESQITPEPESLSDPKRSLQAIGQRARKQAVRSAFEGTWQQQAGWSIAFIQEVWSPKRAAKGGGAPSLNRAIARLERVVA
jgi:hypothetical protein